MKIQKKRVGAGAWVRGVALGGGQGGWEQGSEACVKIQKKKIFFFFGGGGSGLGGGGQGGCEWRSEAFVKIDFFFFFWGGVGSGWVGLGGGVRVDGNGELKLL